MQVLHIYEAGLGHLQTMTQLIQMVLCIAIGTYVRYRLTKPIEKSFRLIVYFLCIHDCGGTFGKREIEEHFKIKVYRQERWPSYAKSR